MALEERLYEVLKRTIILRLSGQRYEVLEVKDEVRLSRSDSKWFPVPNPGEESLCISRWTLSKSTKPCIFQDNVCYQVSQLYSFRVSTICEYTVLRIRHHDFRDKFTLLVVPTTEVLISSESLCHYLVCCVLFVKLIEFLLHLCQVVLEMSEKSV